MLLNEYYCACITVQVVRLQQILFNLRILHELGC